MKNLLMDFRLIAGVIIAQLLLFYSFQEQDIFWYIFTASILVLIIYSLFQGKVDDEASFTKYLFFGIISGLLLYTTFWLGNKIIYHFPIENSVTRLYHLYSPSLFFEYLGLILVAAPGEELFWRGFVQKRLLNYFKPFTSIAAGALLYALSNIYSGSFILVLASFISGLVWGALYYWKKSMPLIIVSHIIFDIMIFIIMPIK
ncbi:CPBP family intramembrane metalloprotease [Bacillus sp. BRMEA1]|uniref:CPBP family intramembrane glutamic endopeptidase n=1 Tax=Neobacillus endophyticus TaxID=2738405 RepID=UPI001566EE5B|nr:type II CAAX endopeptidase family protein [Neobacillus endophyticus]NRD78685.1 CPBP family intramembrane metalloprotease [Neobacillus endophyticus]